MSDNKVLCWRDKRTGITAFKFRGVFCDRPDWDYEHIVLVGPEIFSIKEQLWQGVYRSEVVHLLHGKASRATIPLRAERVYRVLRVNRGRAWRKVPGQVQGEGAERGDSD